MSAIYWGICIVGVILYFGKNLREGISKLTSGRIRSRKSDSRLRVQENAEARVELGDLEFHITVISIFANTLTARCVCESRRRVEGIMFTFQVNLEKSPPILVDVPNNCFTDKPSTEIFQLSLAPSPLLPEPPQFYTVMLFHSNRSYRQPTTTESRQVHA